MIDLLKLELLHDYALKDVEKILKDNNLNLIGHKSHNIDYLLNKSRNILMNNELLKIVDKFNIYNIQYVTFKGVVLADKIYDDIYERYYKDIDIYVDEKDFSKALEMLKNMDYMFRDGETFYDVHHIVLYNRNNIVVELHKFILNPDIKINEQYLRQNIEMINLFGKNICTFNITAMFLHLIYHFYMDAWFTWCDIQYSIIEGKFTETKRFLFRAYEIAKFSEKYRDLINWNDIISDIKSQKFRVVFKKMIIDIINIFPFAFPEKFVDVVFTLKYINDDRDIPLKALYSEKKNKLNDGYLLGEYIDEFWQKRKERNISIKIGESFILTQEYIEKSKLQCEVNVSKSEFYKEFNFKINSSDLVLSNVDEYDIQKSDGVHIILCNTEKYHYSSIFLFPKLYNGNLIIVAYDIINKMVLEDNIACTILVENDKYIVNVKINDCYFQVINVRESFYMGLVVSSCSKITKRRERELFLTEDPSQWFNPIYFAKIRI